MARPDRPKISLCAPQLFELFELFELLPTISASCSHNQCSLQYSTVSITLFVSISSASLLREDFLPFHISFYSSFQVSFKFLLKSESQSKSSVCYFLPIIFIFSLSNEFRKLALSCFYQKLFLRKN